MCSIRPLARLASPELASASRLLFFASAPTFSMARERPPLTPCEPLLLRCVPLPLLLLDAHGLHFCLASCFAELHPSTASITLPQATPSPIFTSSGLFGRRSHILHRTVLELYYKIPKQTSCIYTINYVSSLPYISPVATSARAYPHSRLLSSSSLSCTHNYNWCKGRLLRWPSSSLSLLSLSSLG